MSDNPALLATVQLRRKPRQVRLSLAGPVWATAYVPSRNLYIDRQGVLVPRDAVASIVASAVRAGIALKVSQTQ